MYNPIENRTFAQNSNRHYGNGGYDNNIKMRYEVYDRTKELALFADIYTKSQQEAQMTVLVGRRRIGKTELALRCGHEGSLLYFFVARKSENMLCQDFKEEAERKLDMPLGNYSSFAELFHQLLFISQSHPFTLVIDEFQDWLRINPSIFSEMQREWDLAKVRVR